MRNCGRAIRPLPFYVAGENHGKVARFPYRRANIVRFTDRLKTECDPLKRKVLLELIAGEEAKRANNILSKEK